MPKNSEERIIDWPYAGQRGTGGSGGASGGGGGASTLDALTDVTITAPANADMLVYNAGSGQWINSPASGAGMAAHDLSGPYHTGLLNWALINFASSNLANLATRNHSDLQGIGPNDHHAQQHAIVGPDHSASGLTIGWTLRATAANAFAWAQLQHSDLGGITPNQHHNQQHILATNAGLGADHTISGAAAGYVLRASSPTAANFQQLNHDDLSNVTANQHHNQVHNITGTDHTITGSQFDVVGAIGINLLGLLTPTPAPGAAAALLRTDATGGIQLDTNVLYVDGANNWVGINKTPSGAALDISAAAPAQISQRIKQIAGQSGRLWRIEDSAGNELIVLDSVGNLQSGQPGFVSGLTGWQITPGGNAEFNNIWARGELHATVFVKDEVHASGGTVLVATAGVLYADAAINSTALDTDDLCIVSTAAAVGGTAPTPLQIQTTSATFVGTTLKVEYIGNQLWINDPPSGPGLYYQPGEIVRVKTEIPTGVTDLWFIVTSATQDAGFSRYSVTKKSGTDATIPKGAAIVSYGQPGDGRILMTSDWRADQGYTPYIDVFTTGQNPWDANDPAGIVPRMRLGQLSGVGVQGVSGISQWGMIASNDLTNTNAGYLIASNLGIKLYKVPLYLNNGATNTGYWGADGTLKAGKNIDAAATTGLSFDPATGNLTIGNPGIGNYILWNQAAGVLSVVGALTTTDPGSTVTKTYVDTQDTYFDGLASGYGNTAYSNAQAYSNARRVGKVLGTWKASGTVAQAPTTIVWSGVTLYLGDGTSKTVSDGSVTTGAMGSATARKFLYADVSAAAPLTLIVRDSTAAIGNLNYVLVAVADAGSVAASVTVVGGTTYISGSNIYTGSITANEIAANTITGAKILAGEIHATHLNADVFTTSGGAGAYRALAVQGTITPDPTRYNYVSWSGLAVQKADGTTVTIQNSSVAYPSGFQLTAPRIYFYIFPDDTGTTTLKSTINIIGISASAIMVAIVDQGNPSGGAAANVIMYAGGVVISGDSIYAGSITAAKIQARTITASLIATGTITANELAADSVTATQINVANLQAVSTNTGALTVNGNLTMNGSGAVRSTTKANVGDGIAGFFLGYNSGYKFEVGDGSNNYLQWNGTNLLMRTAQPIDITMSGANNTILTLRDGAGHSSFAGFAWDATNGIGQWVAPAMLGQFYVRTPRIELDDQFTAYPLTVARLSGQGGLVRTMTMNSAGLLTYSGDFAASSNLFSTLLFASGNRINIATQRSDLGSSGAGGTNGDICYGNDGSTYYLYVRIAGAWRRAQLNSY